MTSSGEHIPVLAREVMDLLNPSAGQTVVDATIGYGGHAALLLEAIGPEGTLIGLDVDEGNLFAARQRWGATARIRLVRSNFERIADVLCELGIEAVDVVLADLGMCSGQLDDSSRGFSFQQDGPLDMRLDDRETTTAADLVNRLSERDLADLIYEFGQERFSRKIAKAIHQVRHKARITRTLELANVVCRALEQQPDSHREKIHPATRTFMALRIAVNRELEVLQGLLDQLPQVLRPGGRAAVISFHSLEDGLVKNAFRRSQQEGLAKILTKKPVVASMQERHNNPRARSAKLRVIERVKRSL